MNEVYRRHPGSREHWQHTDEALLSLWVVKLYGSNKNRWWSRECWLVLEEVT